MNLFCGFVAIVQVYEGQLAYACYLIVLAGFFDLLDGMMARLAQGQSLFGVELDSLSDVVSFGAAPSLLVYAFALSEYGVLGVVVSALPVLCAAVRLARYNLAIEDVSQEYYSGLPAPVQAFFLITFVLCTMGESWLLAPGMLDAGVLIPLVLVLSALMVTTLPFEGAPKPTAAYLAARPLAAASYCVAIVLILVLRELGLLIGLVAYLLTGIIRALMRAIHAVRRRRSTTDWVPAQERQQDESAPG